MEDGAELFRITEWELSGPPDEVQMKSKPSFGIGFGDPDFTAEEIWTDRTKAILGVGDLNQAAGIVAEVIESFAGDFPA